MSRLYVGHLAHETTEADLRAAFAPYGEVVSARVMSNRRGRSKEFGYVEMGDEASAKAALEALRGTEIKGRRMDIVLEESSGRRSGGRERGRSASRRR